MRVTASLLLLCCVSGLSVAQGDFTASLPEGPVATAIPSDDWLANHDGTFEGGCSWMGGGIAPEYYGAFAEGFDIGTTPRSVTAVRIYISTLTGWYVGQLVDIYVWERGVSDTPGLVRAVSVGNVPQSVPIWPDYAANDFDIEVNGVVNEVSAGFWVDSSLGHAFYILTDETGLPGHPWTNYAPTSGYYVGWGHPKIVTSWGLTQSMAIEINLEDPPVSGVASGEDGLPDPVPRTWAAIKGMYK